ncbi:MAG: sodium:solute symporter family protein [Candidatus Caenarcaniphilales bacterium]|nr:sodium:solute symporter family protein [Candidatus Caenarcaniphilales bacterium]
MLGFLIFLYLLSTLTFGFYINRKSKNAEDYIFAGSRLPFWVSSFAFFATWFGSEMIIGSASEFLDRGFMALIKDPIGAALCVFLIGVVFAKHYYKMPYLSFADFFKEKFGTKVSIFASFSIILAYLAWLAAQYIAFAVVLKTVFALPMTWGIVIAAVIFLVYVWWGGLLAISLLDMTQTIVIISGLIAVAVPLISEAGGLPEIVLKTDPKFFTIIPEFDFMSLVTYISALITIGLGAIPQQDLYQRVKACKSANVAKYSAIFSSFLYIVICLIPLFIILAVKISNPEILSDLSDEQMALPKIVLEKSNLFVQFLFFGAILSAILSSASVCILAPATVFSENLLRPLFIYIGFKRKVKDLNHIVTIKIAAVIITLISVLMAFIKGNIYHLATEAATVTLVSLVSPFLFAMFAKYNSRAAAVFSMASGLLTWIAFSIFLWEFPAPLAGFLVSFSVYFLTNKLEENQLRAPIKLSSE